MEIEENSYRSQLPQPTKLASPAKCLSEISDSQSNARLKPLHAVSAASLKHKIISFGEPEPKRKTLVERAGESKSIAATMTSSSRPPLKGNSMTRSKPSHSRGYSFSNFSRPIPGSSRIVPNERFSCSVGQRSQSDIANLKRYPSTAFSQSTMTRPTTGISRPRTFTSIGNHESDAGIPRDEIRVGMENSSSANYFLESSNRLLIPKSQESKTNIKSLIGYSHSAASNRGTNLSVSTDIERQEILGKVNPSDYQNESQANSNMMLRLVEATPSSFPTCNSMEKLKLEHTEGAMKILSATSKNKSSRGICSPSHIPVLSKSDALMDELLTSPKNFKLSPQKTPFLTKDSNISGFTEWDVQGRLQNMEAQFLEMRETIKDASMDKKSLEESMAALKARNTELESLHCQLTLSNRNLQSELDSMRYRVETSQQSLLDVTNSLNDRIRAHQLEVEGLRRDNRNEVDKLQRFNTEEIDRLSRLHREQLREIERRTISENDEKLRAIERNNNGLLEEEKNKRIQEVREIERKLTLESSNLNFTLQEKSDEIQSMRGQLIKLRCELDCEQNLRVTAQNELSSIREMMQKVNAENSSTIHSLEHTLASLRARIHFLESGSKAQSDSFAEMEARLEEAVESAKESKRKLIKEESLRRSLFNQVQELKGNIRVMCRVRPVLNSSEGSVAQLKFPDMDRESRALELLGKEEKSSFGTVTRKTHSFSFDRVFGPESQNQDVFEEISQLVQSALDGYNVCIFCYGQTGSGKTHTMSSPDGMIPRATQQIYQTATELRDKGWVYAMEGNFVEVYNEEIHDLLGNSKDIDKKKHEIRHDDQRKQTRVTGLNTVALDSPGTVESILKQAAANRSVAATKSNERSSRSHSVFMLRLAGHNSTTGETSEGTLNLVDLAGSERLKQSGAEGERMRETQNINKSLSCLGDVIGALGQGKEGTHIPYRNSKLTYLLQYSLGGNSKTLMFVMASPLEANLTETLTSLKFATKVHNTHIGTAKKTRKVMNDSLTNIK